MIDTADRGLVYGTREAPGHLGAIARLQVRVGLAVAGLVIAIAIVGPLISPHPPDMIVGSPFAGPSRAYPLGLDFAGRDVLSRFLWGGRTALLLALFGTMLAYALGLPLGLTAAYAGGWVDDLMMRATDVALAFPGLVLVLLMIAAFGSDLLIVVAAVAAAVGPRVVRVVRAAALTAVHQPYVEAARARGEGAVSILLLEVLPNIRSPLLVDVGIRITGSILLVASVGFLGLGLQPPAADWGLMVAENRIGVVLQPWPVLVPTIAIALLTLGINLAVEGLDAGKKLGYAGES